MDWKKLWPGTWACEVRSDQFWPAGIYLYTYVPSGRSKRGNLYYNAKGGALDPVILGCEVTYAHAKRLAQRHNVTAREDAAWEAGRPMTRLEQIREYMQAAREAWQEWRDSRRGPTQNPVEWRQYMAEVAHPLNKAAADLLIEMHSASPREKWPLALEEYVLYVEDYDALIARWGTPDNRLDPDTIGRSFPRMIDAYVTQMADPELPWRKPETRTRLEMLFDKS